jgi:hypothetical protein
MKKLLLFFALITLFCSAQEVPTWMCEQSQQRTYNNDTIVAAGVIRAYPIAVVGSKIEWRFIIDADHDKIFFDSVVAQPSGAIRVYYPTVSKIYSFIASGDEQLKYYQLGASVGMSYADVNMSQIVQNGGELRGNNTNDWSKSDGLKSWEIVRDSTTGLTKLNIKSPNGAAITANDYNRLQVTYTGNYSRLIKRVYSGLGIYTTGFYITDLQGNIITGKSDANDRVVMTANNTQQNFNCYSVQGDSSQLKVFNTTANIWLIGVFKK